MSETVDILTPEKRRKLQAIFAAHPNVQAAYLFGSQVETRYRHRESDVDIGVFVEHDDFDLKLKLVTELMEVFPNVDLVMMEYRDIPDLLLAFEIVHHNQLLYAHPDFDPYSFFSRVLRMYWDFQPRLEVQFEFMKKRLAKYAKKQ